MQDFKLITKRLPGINASPAQPGNPDEYWGESTNDLQLNNINDLDTVEDTDKLKQDINKIIFTERGDNVFLPPYGTLLESMIGGKVDITNVRAKVQSEIQLALTLLLLILQDDPNPDEKPDTLQFLSVEQTDTTTVTVNLSVITVSGKTISGNFVLPAS